MLPEVFDDERSIARRRLVTRAIIILLIIGSAGLLFGTLPKLNHPTSSGLSTSTVGTQVSVTNLGDCGADISCFISAVRSCRNTIVEWTSNVNIFGVFNQTTKAQLALNGPDANGNCSFSDRVDDVTVHATTQAADFARANGISETQTREQIATTEAQLKKTVGVTTRCTFTTSYLLKMLVNWSNGQISSRDFAPGSCSATTADGTAVPVAANGSIPIGSPQQSDTR